MIMNRKTLLTLAASSLLYAPAGVIAGPDEPAADPEGLQLLEEDRHGALYVLPDVDWSGYDSILLEDATVAFRKNWQRDQNRNRRSLADRVDTRDMDRIRNDLAELFDEVFVGQLSGNGSWNLVESAGPSVLRIRPKIVDLDVYAPDVRSSTYSRSYTDSAGRMTLILELYDSETGDLIAAASDHRQAPYRGYMQWTTGVSNKGDARRMLQKWAVALNERLADATGRTPGD
jgi:hypothetical protein